MKDEKYTNELRLTILENSLFHEYLITSELSSLLGVDMSESYSFGDKSTSLSLSSKINLLIDLNILEKVQKTKLLYYLEIRNKFLHNWKCRKFEDCFKSIPSTYKALEKLYSPSQDLTTELKMVYCYNALGEDIVDILINHITKKVIKSRAESQIKDTYEKELSTMTTKVFSTFLEILESDILQKYNIKNEDKNQLLIQFSHKVI
jgi:hypothetical protein